MSGSSPFANRPATPPKSGMSTAMVLLLVGVCVVGLPVVLACGGCFLWMVAPRRVATGPTPSTPTAPQEIGIYTPTEEIFCATDSDFLDSSPLIAPARFVRVRPGTELVRVGFGGMTSKLYWRLSAGGTEQIYVYRDQFDRQFRLVRTIRK